MYKANVVVTLRPSILDPQGKVTKQVLDGIGINGVERVRMGKYMELWIDAASESAALELAQEACRRVLANTVMEDYRVKIEPVEAEAV